MKDPDVSVRTDLAIERFPTHSSPVGVQISKDEFEGGIISRVTVQNERGAEAVGKPPGIYVTIECPGLRDGDPTLRHLVSKTVAAELQQLMPRKNKAVRTTLVVGLGNWNVTPDALGPKVVQELLVTRHLLEYSPESADESIQSVCAIAPGVLGITGMETSEIIDGVVEKVKPDLVIAVDALASRSVERVGTTIQMADTGINPGSGVGNKRKALSQATLGVPVIAIGVPTVVYASTIAQDTLDAVVNTLGKQLSTNELLKLGQAERNALVNNILAPHLGGLVVTPKEIDAIIDDMAKVIAGSLNVALHPELELEDTLYYL
ncbi:MAG: spore protease [Bacillota bacterium]|nr:MAG: spore protease [Bacillota bacterium]MBS3949345.1 GPR endopeptidase [Peptococcaceae bacterium]